MIKTNVVIAELAFDKSQYQTGFPSSCVSKKHLENVWTSIKDFFSIHWEKKRELYLNFYCFKFQRTKRISANGRFIQNDQSNQISDV